MLRALVAGLLLAASAAADDAPVRRNLLLLIADDVGIDLLRGYGVGDEPGRTPHLDALIARGVRFQNVWSYPSCSPGRASLLTGLPAHRNGVGNTVHPSKPWAGLAPSLPTVPRRLRALGYQTFATGKWHLGPTPAHPDFRLDHPSSMGFDSFAGSLGNISSYRSWRKVEDGADARQDVYATTDTVDETLARIRAAEKPWFAWVAFHAIHQPWSDPPPAHLHGYLLDEAPGSVKARAILEALDAEIGRLLAGIPPAQRANTTVVFTSDNGTDSSAIGSQLGRDQGKFTLYESGLRVPLVFAGPDVPPENAGRAVDALVHVSDLSATLVALAGGDAQTRDSRSLVPYLLDPARPSERQTLYSEKFKPNGIGAERKRWTGAIRSADFKLIAHRRRHELYDLRTDPAEAVRLSPDRLTPEQQKAYDALVAGLEAMERDGATRPPEEEEEEPDDVDEEVGEQAPSADP